MKPSNELFNLIKSLTKSEKRFFKLSSSLQSGEKNYLKLFESIENQSFYDEEMIKEIFKKEIFIKHLPSEKNHLYKLILKSLRAYYSESSVISIIQEDIKNVEILFKKALYKEGAKIIKKTKKIAYQYEKFYYLFVLINWEKMMLEEEYQAGNFDNNLDELIEEERKTIEKLQNLAEYRGLFSKINFVFRKGGYARNEEEKNIVKEISNHPLIKGKNTAKSKSAAATCYYIQGLCAVVKDDYPLSFQNFSKVIEIFEANKNLIQEMPKQYLRSMSNMLFCFLNKNDYNSFFKVLNKMRSMQDQPGFDNNDIRVKIFSSTYNAELIALDQQCEYEKGLKLVPIIEKGIKMYEGKISKEEEILFFYNIAYTCYGALHLKDALKWINKIINDNEAQLRQDVYGFSRLLYVVIHFDLKNYELLDYFVKSTLRYYQKRKKESERDYEFEIAFLKFIKKLIKVTLNEGNVADLLKTFKKELKMILKNDFEKVALNYFDFKIWIDSKINEVSFTELKKQELPIRVN